MYLVIIFEDLAFASQIGIEIARKACTASFELPHLWALNIGMKDVAVVMLTK